MGKMKINNLLSRLKPRSLATRAMLITTLPILLLGAMMTWFFFDRHWDTQTRQIARAVSGELLFLAEEMEEGHADHNLLEFYRLYFLIGVSVVESPPPTMGSCFGSCSFLLKTARRVSGERPVLAAGDREGVTVYLGLTNGLWLRAQIAQKRLSASTALLFGVFVLASALVLGTIAVLFLQSQVRGIKRLANAMDAFGSRGGNIPLRYGGTVEVRRATKAFEEMKSRITRLVQQRSRMLAGVSHDLKTVLARMKLAIPTLGGKGGKKEGELVSSLKTDIKDMEEILNSYLDFAAARATEADRRINLKDEIKHFAVKFKKRLRLNCGQDIFVTTKPLTLRRVVANLVDNALRYGAKVEINVVKRRKYATISVEDDGPGIPAHKRREVLKAFARLDKSRTPGLGGSGLGLAIAAGGATALGGELKIAKSALGGVKASLRLAL